MNNIMSKTALELYLNDIKEIFKNYDFDKLKKMVFMSIDSFLSFIDYDRETGESGKSFKEIIETIEPFIPMVVSDESLSDYLLTAISQDEAELVRLQNQFVQNSKIRFVKNIMSANSVEDLEEVLEACRTIREYKEKAAF